VRQLSKLPIPSILQANKQVWTEEYKAAAAAGEKPPERWLHPEIVSTLRKETYDKCAYCEGYIPDVSYSHVEHILPKSARPDLVVSWSNLTTGCQICNTAKSNYYAEDAPLLHPYDEDPAEHIQFQGPAICAPLGNTLGERTILRLNLKRPPLLVQRMEKIQALHDLLERWHSETGPDRDLRESVVRDALADDREYVCCLRTYAANMGFPYYE
jgi:hypothetical protein